jgi:uncharacterized membrane protein
MRAKPMRSRLAALLGVSSMVFGIVQFLYAHAIASMIPPWIPGALGRAYLVGGAESPLA